MFPKIYFTIAILAWIFTFACNPSKEFPKRYKGDQIHFGQGGGFTGSLSYFILLENGSLYQRSFRDTTFAQVDAWPDVFVSQMFSNYKMLRLDTVDHYEPGDIYYFIEYHSRENNIHRISWGRPGFRPEENIVTYYNLLYKSTKSKS